MVYTCSYPSINCCPFSCGLMLYILLIRLLFKFCPKASQMLVPCTYSIEVRIVFINLLVHSLFKNLQVLPFHLEKKRSNPFASFQKMTVWPYYLSDYSFSSSALLTLPWLQQLTFCSSYAPDNFSN